MFHIKRDALRVALSLYNYDTSLEHGERFLNDNAAVIYLRILTFVSFEFDRWEHKRFTRDVRAS